MGPQSFGDSDINFRSATTRNINGGSWHYGVMVFPVKRA